ncbi:hypothetical protein DGG96_14895 [Legionella qingyii]|uniref:Uncharacterized protein n=1 Tax=Legionella qingyii TaxID=2184757 RepID=A0A317U1W2_9GAMM|nr:hypothetical protein [Legionella qingyii]PWY54787.1 hypothetical protein DGG96_14895 [Legionella qingyii]RUR22511.1 hypothetical protein ELY20_09480 [Legionella qingyii]RUR27982.1 hypothetical protein ELY16_04215 [Legionella qingyii]
MLTDAILDETIATLSSYNGKHKNDPLFDNYKEGIKKALVDFINQCKRLPLAQQLNYIAKEMKEKTGSMSAKIDKVSGGKRSWTLVFAITALAIERKQNLPKDHPEIAFIDMLLSGLSNGWVNAFNWVGITGLRLNQEAINKVIDGMKGWIQKYDINQGEQTSHDILLALYTSLSSFEEKLTTLYLTPKKYKDEMGAIKALLTDKFNELKNKLENKNRPSVQLVDPLEKLAPKEDISYQRFKDQLNHLKMQQAQILQNINTFPQEQFNRITQLQQLLNEQPSVSSEDLMSQFWSQYDTQKKFNQLLIDLDIPENERSGWNEYFKYQHGSYQEQAISLLWTGRWGLPQFIGGIPSKTISLEILRSKNDTALKPLQIIQTQIERHKLIPDEEKPYHLIISIEDELNNLAELKKVKRDLLEEVVDVISHKTTNALAKINSDIEELINNLEKQKKMIQSLKSIHEKIERLKKHVDCTSLEDSFRLFLDEASNKIRHTVLPLPSDLSIAKKIAALDFSIARAQENVQGLQLSINYMVKECKSQKSSVIVLVSDFIHTKENTLGHAFLSFFSSSYKSMFKELKEALNEESIEDRLNKIKAILGISNELRQEKEIASQFQKLKEEAQEVLSKKGIEEMPILIEPN